MTSGKWLSTTMVIRALKDIYRRKRIKRLFHCSRMSRVWRFHIRPKNRRYCPYCNAIVPYYSMYLGDYRCIICQEQTISAVDMFHVKHEGG